MINRLSIKNYKSIKDITLNTKRVNVFIGEHNSGKSNILEAMSWLSLNMLEPSRFQQVFRFKTANDFFYDGDISRPIDVITDDLCLRIQYARTDHNAILNYFDGVLYDASSDVESIMQQIRRTGSANNFNSFILKFDGNPSAINGELTSKFKTYVFKRVDRFYNGLVPFLNPPFGDNIPSLLVSNVRYKELISSIFKEKGFRLILKPVQVEMEIAKEVNDELYVYPYETISETLQRIVFYTLAIETNKNSILIFDEPESNTFPMYTKQMAEMIALDSSNQYFIATHNPYLLGSIISKTPSSELAVFVTKMDNYSTMVSEVSEANLSMLLSSGIDFFFNLNKLTDTDE